MPVIIPDARIRRHLRARGLVGRITPAFIAGYRRNMGLHAVLSAVAESGLTLNTALGDPAVIAAAEAKARSAAEALHG